MVFVIIHWFILTPLTTFIYLIGISHTCDLYRCISLGTFCSLGEIALLRLPGEEDAPVIVYCWEARKEVLLSCSLPHLSQVGAFWPHSRWMNSFCWRPFIQGEPHLHAGILIVHSSGCCSLEVDHSACLSQLPLIWEVTVPGWVWTFWVATGDLLLSTILALPCWYHSFEPVHSTLLTFSMGLKLYHFLCGTLCYAWAFCRHRRWPVTPASIAGSPSGLDHGAWSVVSPHFWYAIPCYDIPIHWSDHSVWNFDSHWSDIH